MNKTVSNKTKNQQGVKPYNSIKLTVYGKMVKLTASGLSKTGENQPGAGNALKKP